MGINKYKLYIKYNSAVGRPRAKAHQTNPAALGHPAKPSGLFTGQGILALEVLAYLSRLQNTFSMGIWSFWAAVLMIRMLA